MLTLAFVHVVQSPAHPRYEVVSDTMFGSRKTESEFTETRNLIAAETRSSSASVFRDQALRNSLSGFLKLPSSSSLWVTWAFLLTLAVAGIAFAAFGLSIWNTVEIKNFNTNVYEKPTIQFSILGVTYEGNTFNISSDVDECFRWGSTVNGPYARICNGSDGTPGTSADIRFETVGNGCWYVINKNNLTEPPMAVCNGTSASFTLVNSSGVEIYDPSTQQTVFIKNGAIGATGTRGPGSTLTWLDSRCFQTYDEQSNTNTTRCLCDVFLYSSNATCDTYYSSCNGTYTTRCDGASGPAGAVGATGAAGRDGVNASAPCNVVLVSSNATCDRLYTTCNNTYLDVCDGAQGATGPAGAAGASGTSASANLTDTLIATVNIQTADTAWAASGATTNGSEVRYVTTPAVGSFLEYAFGTVTEGSYYLVYSIMCDRDHGRVTLNDTQNIAIISANVDCYCPSIQFRREVSPIFYRTAGPLTLRWTVVGRNNFTGTLGTGPYFVLAGSMHLYKRTGGVLGTTTFLSLPDTPASFANQGYKFARVNAASTAIEFASASSEQAIVMYAYRMAVGINGGTNTINSWTTYPFNSTAIAGNATYTSMSAASVLTIQPGRYYIEARAVFYAVGYGLLRFRDMTAGVDIDYGIIAYSVQTVGHMTYASLNTVISIGTATTYAIQYYTTQAQGSIGLGFSLSATGVPNEYGRITIMRLPL